MHKKYYLHLERCFSFLFSHLSVFFVFIRSSDRLGNGVLYASVNPEYFSAAESERSARENGSVLLCVTFLPDVLSRASFPSPNLCSVRARRVGGGAGEDLPEPRVGPGIVRHGVRGPGQGRGQGRAGDARRHQDGERVGQHEGEDRVPERSLRHEGVQLPPRGTIGHPHSEHTKRDA